MDPINRSFDNAADIEVTIKRIEVGLLVEQIGLVLVVLLLRDIRPFLDELVVGKQATGATKEIARACFGKSVFTHPRITFTGEHRFVALFSGHIANTKTCREHRRQRRCHSCCPVFDDRFVVLTKNFVALTLNRFISDQVGQSLWRIDEPPDVSQAITGNIAGCNASDLSRSGADVTLCSDLAAVIRRWDHAGFNGGSTHQRICNPGLRKLFFLLVIPSAQWCLCRKGLDAIELWAHLRLRLRQAIDLIGNPATSFGDTKIFR